MKKDETPDLGRSVLSRRVDWILTRGYQALRGTLLYAL